MLTRADLCQALDHADIAFQDCWLTLSRMKSVQLDSAAGERLLKFQPTLAEALFRLDKLRRVALQESRALIERKRQLNSDWFANRIRTLARYRLAVDDAIKIGRTIGDAFAWFFYIESQDIIEQHAQHVPVSGMPDGIGGKGELEFIKHAHTPGYMLLYHGVTTFLRVGDISFVHLATWRVVALGELKSQKVAPNQLRITLHMLGTDRDRMPFADPVVNIVPGAKQPAGTPLSLDAQARLKRQMKAMGAAMEPQTTEGNEEVRDSYQTDELRTLADDLRFTSHAYVQVGAGLLITAVRPRVANSLRGRVLSDVSGEKIVQKLSGLTKRVVGIMRPLPSENFLFIGELDTGVVLGHRPLFWSSIDAQFLKSLYFKEIITVTCYNPGHLFAKLRKHDFAVQVAAGARAPLFTVSKRIGNHQFAVPDMAFFLGLVQNNMFREDKVIEMVLALAARASSGELPDNARIQLAIVHKLGNPPRCQ